MRIRSFFILLLLSFLFVPRARLAAQDSSQTKDSLLALTEATLAQDSIQATDGAMLPYANEFIRQSRRHRVPAPLLAGITQVESKFEPYATRTEPSYQKNPIVQRAAKKWSKAHHGIPTAQTELQDRSRSYGLMQPMGELAREQGYDSTYLATLYIPDLNVEQGAIKLDSLFKRYKRDTLAVISAYNLGSARRSHGAYENAQYVYSVIVATHYYEKALHYAYLHPQSKETIRLAGRNRDTTHDRGVAPEPALQPERDSSAGIAQNNSHPGSLGPLMAGYGMGTRYGNDQTEPEGEGESIWDVFYEDRFFAIGFLAIAAGLLGLVISIYRYERRWSGYDRRVPGRSESNILSRPSISEPGPIAPRSIPSH
jgi:soluble lytic murein transglycosylase-like protein